MAAKRRKRGYSQDFRAHGVGKRYLMEGIPAGWWTEVRKQAAFDGWSMRGLILTLLRDWLTSRQTQQQRTGNGYSD